MLNAFVGAAEGCDLLTFKEQKIAAFGSSYKGNFCHFQRFVLQPLHHVGAPLIPVNACADVL